MAQKKKQPIGNKLIALPLPKAEEKLDTLIIPETANANLMTATVIERSEELKELISVGDTIIYNHGSGVGDFYNGKSHLWLTIDQVWGVTTKDDK